MLIKTKNLSKSYGSKLALKDLTIELLEGELVAYLGTNGAGKSTTMKLLTGLLEASSGQISKKLGLSVGVVFQESVLDSDLTVAQNLKSRIALYHHKNQEWYEKLLDLLEIKPLLTKRYGLLSGGQRRRVDIARALVHQPDILFLDEPTTGLDVQTRTLLWQFLNRLKEQGLTIFLTTHYLEEAEQADKIYILEEGRLLAQGKVSELIATHAKNRLFITCNPASSRHFEGARRIDSQTLVFEAITTKDSIAILSRYAPDILDFNYQKATLSDAFMALTGKEIK
ncbi:ABC transporter ATP-binding protein [Streptococcus sp. CSL10205-OR2]|uniref:ABC transporter ATP-binding protein n=1 Tax=Streptococcus sp. CSL10205-OR2 TaxID=2980558 RepID=UPI0021DB28E7|nr:ABC transporter ATP-binding protein [Streptococcus sp. CSL10205-OR2]MCU9533124.1 ABC transporter ATP-binding protein [Streptococcus sp. CSL10205-OR2]